MREPIDEAPPVSIGVEDLPPLDAPNNYMVERSRIVETRAAWYVHTGAA